LMSQMAALLGLQQDADRYAKLADEIRAAWLREFRHADTRHYATNSQCSNALALVLGLVEPTDRENALAALVTDVRDRGNAMTAGDVGFRYLIQALARGGQSDVVYAMINQDERPGYGYQLKQGATSLTEAWDANHNSSHNHFMLGHITEWFYKDLVGIDTDPRSPGFKRILIRPTPVGDLKWARAAYRSCRGPITVRWDRDGKQFRLAVEIPPNTTGKIYLPARDESDVQEGKVRAADADGVRAIGRESDRVVFEIESGSYNFTSQL
jgi:alpha-L-rhamnosidase